MPQRIQMSRQHPWRRRYPNVVKVDRTTKWGNPVPGVGVRACRRHREVPYALHHGDLKITVADVRRELAGRDLACWCGLDQECHADVLLEVANAGDAGWLRASADGRTTDGSGAARGRGG